MNISSLTDLPLGTCLPLNPEAVRRAERMDGKYVLLTNDDTLTPEDVGLGYKAMMIIETCFRRLKTTGLRLRPVYHWTAHRIVSHVKLCVLAPLLQRAAEIRPGGICGSPWSRSRPFGIGCAGRPLFRAPRRPPRPRRS